MTKPGYPNIKAVLILSVGFYVLFIAFFASANSASKALREAGYSNLGFYSLAVLYLFFSLSSFFTPLLIQKWEPKWSMVIASLTYALWIITLALTSLVLKNDSLKNWFSYESVYCIVILASVINGAGCSLLWIAQGKYLSDSAMLCLERKGTYNSIFWTTMLSAQFSSSILNAYVLGEFP